MEYVAVAIHGSAFEQGDHFDGEQKCNTLCVVMFLLAVEILKVKIYGDVTATH